MNVQFLDVAVALLGMALGWLFKLIGDNRASLQEIDKFRRDEHTKFLAELKSERVARESEIAEIHKSMTQNCSNVNDKIEAHKLYIANNYLNDAKVNKLMEQYTRPLHDQLALVQTTLNVLVTKLGQASCPAKLDKEKVD